MTRARKRQRASGHGSQSAELRVMPVRPTSLLLQIKRHYGSAVMAAMLGQINAEEFLLLEKISAH